MFPFQRTYHEAECALEEAAEHSCLPSQESKPGTWASSAEPLWLPALSSRGGHHSHIVLSGPSLPGDHSLDLLLHLFSSPSSGMLRSRKWGWGLAAENVCDEVRFSSVHVGTTTFDHHRDKAFM